MAQCFCALLIFCAILLLPSLEVIDSGRYYFLTLSYPGGLTALLSLLICLARLPLLLTVITSRFNSPLAEASYSTNGICSSWSRV
ncbi:hypothetical protein HBI56_125870 [Parastagonospora nodorum]|uniref:Uncharacterized protein n=1 Tax=Phaeosphaeria nodorum (strain SN15 / ATCC MYA-4574 / FGSC 10173) TaxID=321614 RepID=A0A7U2I1Q0_PHANO|nr:hypothetical protein HBH56_167210 [Parastagonospora nodorum]QRC98608.1 hypothetical protein JI435_412360 [Parastagonospora nodorum SN15]KAH3936221.1 hypothetical protein HBH54_030290 [Parastagonospora nodorum]KAH3948243.1 hypothetical protein HBH53_105100 [Parastagonospora nodorum]KAH3968705.1 hypothetical protein HBH51_129000 [Parastagonospora nodorum]